MRKWENALYTNILLDEKNKKIYFTPDSGNYAYGLVVQKQQDLFGLGKAIINDAFGVLYDTETDWPKPLILFEVYKKMKSESVEKGIEYLKTLEKINLMLIISVALKTNLLDWHPKFVVREAALFHKKEYHASKKDQPKTLGLNPNNDKANEMLSTINQTLSPKN